MVFAHMIGAGQMVTAACPSTYRGYLYSMHSSAANNVWIAVSLPYGDTGRVACFHWNGTVYTQHDFTSANIPTNMGTNIFTYGASNTYLWTGNELARWTGSSWSVVFTNPNSDGEGALLGGSGTTLYIVLRLYGGATGGVAVYSGSGSTWTHISDTELDDWTVVSDSIYHPGLGGTVGFRQANPSGGISSGGAAYCLCARERTVSATQRYCVVQVNSVPAVKLFTTASLLDSMNSLSYVGGTWYFVGQHPSGSVWENPFVLVSPSWSQITEPTYSADNSVNPRSVGGVSTTDLWMAGDWNTYRTSGIYQLFVDRYTGSWAHTDYSPATFPYHSFNHVHAIASNDVWIIGQLCGEGPPAPTSIVLHWNGTAWSRRDIPPGS